MAYHGPVLKTRETPRDEEGWTPGPTPWGLAPLESYPTSASTVSCD